MSGALGITEKLTEFLDCPAATRFSDIRGDGEGRAHHLIPPREGTRSLEATRELNYVPAHGRGDLVYQQAASVGSKTHAPA